MYRPRARRPVARKAPARRYAPARSYARKAPAPRSYAPVRRAPAPRKRTSGPYRSSGIGQTLGSTAGQVIGGLIPGGSGIGGVVGGIAGNLGEKLFRNITGLGEYSIKSNSIMGQDPPLMHSTGKSNNTFRIRHREYLTDVITNAPNSFSVKSYPISVTAQATFPWLAQIANQFQEWRPMGIVFEFKSTSGDALNSVNTALGTVIMATQYNSVQNPPATKQQMENTQYTTSCKPSVNMMHCVECDPSQMVLPRLYCQKPSRQTNIDERFSKLGQLYVATSGFQGTSVNVGELWCTYDVELSFPIEQSNTALLGTHFILNQATITASNPLGTDAAIIKSTGTSNLSVTLAPTTIQFDKDLTASIMVQYALFGSSTAMTFPTFTGSNGVTQLLLLDLNQLNTESPPQTSTVMNYTAYFQVISPGDGTIPTITIGTGGTLPSSLVSGDLIINTIQPQA